ncbi:unnamed protein product [Bursaphelenchus okinawaensis]|uniref:G-protein coupled receptors family 1 profile domain-containing protein n=1 Tax=Bursaphelenchus okinawaensis TaxID=465554 RepID=A0A811LM47_9BILA|nr:unnamed protein product [Bursaphelenchus okinawaensis]CAG9124991.1 unnamed protein product [Bursaphelenchus okinawaensis]
MDNSSDSEPPGDFCLNPQIVSPEFIIGFTEITDAALLICTLASSCLQLFVLQRAYQHIRRKTADKCLHVFLFSMTLADFILTGICYPIEFSPRTNFFPQFPFAINAAMHMLCWISLIVSSVSLVFMNIDKLFYFQSPLRYTEHFTRRRSLFICTLCWAFSIAFVIFAWVRKSFRCVDDNCATLAIFPNRLHIYIPFMLSVGVIPTVTSLTVALYILKIMQFHRNQIKQEKLLCSPNTNDSRQNSVFVTKIRTFYFVFMTTVFTAITLLPYRFVGIYRALNPARKNECATILMFWIFMYMVYLNSIVNPLLTITILPQYRLKCFERFSARLQRKYAPNEPDSARESL